MARDRNKPTQSWMERAKIEIEHEEELTIERAYELGKIRGRKETIDKACRWLKRRYPIVNTDDLRNALKG